MVYSWPGGRRYESGALKEFYKTNKKKKVCRNTGAAPAFYSGFSRFHAICANMTERSPVLCKPGENPGNFFIYFVDGVIFQVRHDVIRRS